MQIWPFSIGKIELRPKDTLSLAFLIFQKKAGNHQYSPSVINSYLEPD